MKQIQVSEALYKALVIYFILDLRTEETEQTIVAELKRKADAMLRRQAFSEYRKSEDPEEKQEALGKYLHESFHW